MALRLTRIIFFALAALASAQMASCEEISKAPLTLYAFGGAADIWSTRGLPPFNDRSPAGPVVGPVLSSLAFASADALLQSKGHHGWAKVVRVVYVVGTVALVAHNRGFRDALHQR